MTDVKEITVIVPEATPAVRIDKFLAGCSDLDLTRSRIQWLIGANQVTVNGAPVNKSYDVAPGDSIVVAVPPPTPHGAEAEDIPIEVAYEDEFLAVINKPIGMVTHPAAGNRTGTLVNAIMYRFDKLAAGSADDRPGIVHRLDKDTSGLLLVAKNDKVYHALQKALQAREIHRRYAALICGHVPEEKGVIDAPIGRSPKNRKKMAVFGINAREARTQYYLKKRYRVYDLLDVVLETGRTHQIRVHFTFTGRPVFGDPDYGGREKFNKGIFAPERKLGERLLSIMPRQALHARRLEFTHPVTGDRVEVEAPLPDDFAGLLEMLDSEGV